MKLPTMSIDMGSSNTAIYQIGAGVVLSEPSVVAISDNGKKKLKAVGIEAKKLLGKTVDGTEVISPIFESEISDAKTAAIMLDSFLNKVTLKGLGKRPGVLFSVPCGAENASIKQYESVLNDCGAYNVSFVQSPILTALGLDVPLSEANPCFVIDIGGGATGIAAVSLGGIIAGINVNMGGKTLDAMLIKHVEEHFGLRIGTLTAERLKIQVGSLIESDGTATVVNGRDGASGKPRAVSVSAKDIAQPVKRFFDKIFELSAMVMAKLPAEVSADIRRAGVYFAGGTSKLVGLDDYFKFNMGIRANIAAEPQLATVIGGGIVCGSEKLLSKLRINRK